MTILEALNAKKQLRRSSVKGEWRNPDLDIHFTPTDILAADWEVKPDPQEYYLVLEPIGDIMYLVARNNPPEIGQAIHVREVNHD